MAANFLKASTPRDAKAKVLAICGSLHARTHNRAFNGKGYAQLWPCFASLLSEIAGKHRQVKSVHIVPRSGQFFAAVGEDGIGRVHTIRRVHEIEQAELGELANGAWDWELHLPRATPVTFLAAPSAFLPE